MTTKNLRAVCGKCGMDITDDVLFHDDKCHPAVPKRKDPAAVSLGRKGGKKTGRKGFAAMDPAKAKRIRGLAAHVRKAMAEPSVSIFEYATNGNRNPFYRVDSQRERSNIYNLEFAEPLLRAGFLVLDHTIPREFGLEHHFRSTDAGILWWIRERINEIDAIDEKYRPGVELSSLLETFDQHIAGDHINLHYFQFEAGIRSILEGLTSFVSYYSADIHMPRMDERLTVRLTDAGEAFWRKNAAPLGEW